MVTSTDTSRITIYAKRSNQPTSELQEARDAFSREGYAGPLAVERIYRLEGSVDPQKLECLLANPNAGETLVQISDPNLLHDEHSIEVAYRPAVIDPETLTGLDASKLLGIEGLEYIRLSYRYIAPELDNAEIKRIAVKHLCNPVVQIIVGKNDYTQTLHPAGHPEPLKWYDLSGLTVDQLIDLSINASWYAPLDQMQAVQTKQKEINRPWRDAELEMILQSWGDHCFHTTWKRLGLFKYLKEATYAINHPLCQGLPLFGDNSGPMRFYDGYVLFIKFESHNHPSAIFPKGGIETKHGGLLRDLMEMGKGGYPLCAATIIGTRRPSEPYSLVPKGALHPRDIVMGAISGTASYCNPMGVPMAYTDYQEDPGYAKCWALGGGFGYSLERDIWKQSPQKGNILILFGGKTGRDGVHGATASSSGLTAGMVIKEGASVQIGHPIIERQTATVIPILTKRGLIIWITDLGAGGISCAVGETVAECGADVDLTNLPLKDTSLASWEKWISESQERGLAVVEAENVEEVLAIFRQYGIEAIVLGVCRDDRRLVVKDHDEVAVDMDLDFLWNGCPISTSTIQDPGIVRIKEEPLPIKTINSQLLATITSDYACADQSYATNQYDSTVQGRTVVGPLINRVPSDAFVCTPLYDKPYGAVMTCAYNARWSTTDPVGSIGNLMALAISRAIAIGVSLEDMVFCGNYYTPTRTPEQRWYLSQMVHRAADLSRVFGTPFVSGKDSSSGTFTDKDGNKIDVPLTFVPSILGRMPNIDQVITKTFKKADEHILIIRPRCIPNMAGSVALDKIDNGLSSNTYLPWVNDNESLINYWRLIHELRPNFSSIAAIHRGGAFLQLLYGIIASNLGADINLQPENAMWNLLGECPGSLLVTTSTPASISGHLSLMDFECIDLGHTTKHGDLQIRAGNHILSGRKDHPIILESWQNGFTKELGI